MEPGAVMLTNRLMWIAIGLTTLGAAYGYIGGVMNENPFYAPVYSHQANTTGAFDWKPSKVWITSYSLCCFEIGVRNTRSGFMFFTEQDRTHFLVVSCVLGALLGLFFSFLIFLIRRLSLRRS
jgi:hypothetical protein